MTVATSSLKGHMERQHGRIPPYTREVEVGGWGGGTSCLCSFLPLGAEDGEMSGAGLYGNSTYCGPDEVMK